MELKLLRQYQIAWQALVLNITLPLLLLAVAATTVARQIGVWCKSGSCYRTTTGELQRTSRSHDYTVTRKAESPLDQVVSMRFGNQLTTNKPQKCA
eukprot:262640-Pleurochrysis_carterae.AAC.2